jgi:hypothetical protein
MIPFRHYYVPDQNFLDAKQANGYHGSADVRVVAVLPERGRKRDWEDAF